MGTCGDATGTDMQSVLVKARLVHQTIGFLPAEEAQQEEPQLGHEGRPRSVPYTGRDINSLLVRPDGHDRTGINALPAALWTAGLDGPRFGPGREHGGGDNPAQHQAGTVAGIEKRAVPTTGPDAGGLTHADLVQVPGY